MSTSEEQQIEEEEEVPLTAPQEEPTVVESNPPVRPSTFRDDLWDNFPAIITRYTKSKDTLKSIYTNFKHEKDFLQKLGKHYAKSKLPTDGSGHLEPILKQMMEFYHVVGEKYQEDSNALGGDLFNSLRKVKRDIGNKVKSFSDEEKKLKRDLHAAQTTEKNAQKADDSQSKTLVKLAEQRQAVDTSNLPPKKIEKMDKQLQSAADSALKNREQYAASVKKLQETDTNYYAQLGKMMDTMQRFDLERLQFTKEHLLEYAQLQINLGQLIQQQAQKMKDSITSLDENECIQKFISENSTKKKPLAPDSFQPYFKEEQMIQELVDNAKAPKEMSMPEVSLPTTHVTPSEPSSGSTPKEKVRALYEYPPQKDDELHLKEGDLITVILKNSDGWWLGENDRGEKGEFPSNYVESYQEDSSMYAPPEQETPEEEKQLPDSIENQVQETNEEPQVETTEEITTQQEETVPVEETTESSVPPEQPELATKTSNTTPTETCTTLYPYTARDQTEMTFEQGDQIVVLEKHDDGWWYGSNQRTQQNALFPANYTDAMGP